MAFSMNKSQTQATSATSVDVAEFNQKQVRVRTIHSKKFE